jgi:phosphinothricin acetyltransferase
MERRGRGTALSSSFPAEEVESSRQTTDLQLTDMSTEPRVTIRRAVLADAAAIAEIYNEAILTTTATFDTEPKTIVDREHWLQSHDERHPVLVAVLDDQVVGWASLAKWSDRRAYDEAAETSFYVKSTSRGRGIGRKLKDAIIVEARRLGFHTLIARVAAGSDASLHLNEQAGFIHVGTLKEVGRKFGRLLDVHIMQKMLD